MTYKLAVTPFDVKCPISYLMALVMFALSLTVFEIFAKPENFKNINFKNEGQGVEERDLRHSTGNVRFHIGDLFPYFSYLKIYV